MALKDYTAICPAREDKDGKAIAEMQATVNFDFHEEDISNGDTVKQIQEKLDKGEWKPGMAKPKKSNLEKAKAAADNMSPEEIRAFIESIKDKM